MFYFGTCPSPHLTRTWLFSCSLLQAAGVDQTRMSKHSTYVPAELPHSTCTYPSRIGARHAYVYTSMNIRSTEYMRVRI